MKKSYDLPLSVCIAALIVTAVIFFCAGILTAVDGEIKANQRCDELMSKRPIPRGNAPKVVKKPKEISKCLHDNGSIKDECIGGMGSNGRSKI